MTARVATGVRTTVNLAVLGWTANDSDLNEAIGEAVRSYVATAAGAGLDSAEIATDVSERWAARFSGVSVDLTRRGMDCRADVLAVAVSVPAPAPARALAA